VRRQKVQIELDERRACLHFVAWLHTRDESLASEHHSIDTYVHQEFDALLRSQGHRVPCRMERDNFALAR
jgi:hypothetical protein